MKAIRRIAALTAALACSFLVFGQGKELKVHYRWNNQFTISDSGTLKPVFAFAAQKTGFTLKDVANPVATNDVAEFQLQAAELFGAADIYGGSSIAEYFYQYGREGGFVDLVPYLKSGKLPNFKKFLDSRPDVYAALLTPDGKLYHMPYVPDGGVARVYYLRTDWLAKLGLKTPTTTEELEKVLVAFRDRDPNGNGKKDEIPYFNDKYREGLRLLNLWGARVYGNDNYGVRIVADQKGAPLYHAWTDPKFRAALVEYSRWYREGLIDQQLFTRKENAARKELLTKLNVGGMTHEWVASTGGYNYDAALLKAVPDFKFEVILPVAAKGGAAFEEHARIVVKPDGWAVSAASKNKDNALKFMDWFYSPEGRNTSNFGVQGQTWNTLANGHPVFTAEALKWQYEAGGMNRALWTKQGAQAPIGYHQDYEYERPWTPEIAQKGVALYEAKVKNVFQTPVMTFTAAEQEVINEVQDVLNTYIEEAVIKMVINGGASSDVEWKAYLKRANEIGAPRLVAAYQSAYERWLKTAK